MMLSCKISISHANEWGETDVGSEAVKVDLLCQLTLDSARLLRLVKLHSVVQI